MHIKNQLSDPLTDTPLLHYLCQAVCRSQPSGHPSRLPILPRHLKAIKSQLSKSSLLSHDKLAYRAAFTYAFFGFCRVSEFTSPAPTTPSHSPSFADLHLSSGHFTVALHHSKTNQFGSTQTMSISATHTSLCPVGAIAKYAPFRQPFGPCPLFILSTGKFLTRQDVVHVTRLMLSRVAFDAPSYNTHSFRIGAATTAATAGIPDHLIEHLGRWSSNAYQRYIRPQQSSSEAAARKMCRTWHSASCSSGIPPAWCHYFYCLGRNQIVSSIAIFG